MFKRLRYKIVELIFERLFREYVFPFEIADDRLVKMKDLERNEYYRKAIDILESKVYQSELEDLIRHFYEELAIKTKDRERVEACRLTLIMLQKLNNRFQLLSQMYRPPELPNNFNQL